MSSERDRVKELAERVARKLADAAEPAGRGAAADGGDLASLRSALGEIQRRLAHVESHLSREDGCEHGAKGEADEAPRRQPSSRDARQHAPSGAQAPARSMWLSGTYVPAVSHPSQERFTNVGEAVSELVEFLEGEKTCNVEPGGKPCDHCGMCSSRGF